MSNKTNFVKFQFNTNQNLIKNREYINNCDIGEEGSNITSNITSNMNMTSNVYVDINTSNSISDGILCSYCSESGHIIKTCPRAVVSFGLICYYQKQIAVPDNNLNNTFFNKRTKKYYGHNHTTGLRRNQRGWGYHNLPKIKILKRNETLSHTLKNMLGITSADNDLDNYSNLEGEADADIAANTNANNNEETDENNDVDELTDEANGNDNSHDDDNQKKIVNCQKVILVQRRNTIGFIEFMRGKYEAPNHEYIIKLFNMMTFDEKRILREYDTFDTIRKIIGLGRENIYKREYDDAKIKFETLRNHPDGNMVYKLLDKSITRWNSPEWGLPKGRRRIWNHTTSHSQPTSNDVYSMVNKEREIDIECAIREFVEETGIKYKNLVVYRNVKPLEEIYKGINGVLYKHVYYLAELKNTDEARLNIETVEKGGQLNFEVSNVKCFGLSECHRIIRPYYNGKLNAIKKGFQLINSINQYFE
jgi:8-oxo-dGTP pyrophosphatase MutT (NUDIX family)